MWGAERRPTGRKAGTAAWLLSHTGGSADFDEHEIGLELAIATCEQHWECSRKLQMVSKTPFGSSAHVMHAGAVCWGTAEEGNAMPGRHPPQGALH